jgi:hypothetical protein
MRLVTQPLPGLKSSGATRIGFRVAVWHVNQLLAASLTAIQLVTASNFANAQQQTPSSVAANSYLATMDGI